VRSDRGLGFACSSGSGLGCGSDRGGAALFLAALFLVVLF